MNIVFSGSYIQSNLLSAFICILLPIGFLWYYKRKTGVKVGAFFIGAAFSLLFSYFVTYTWNILILSVTGLGSFLSTQNHPVYSAIYGAASIGLFSTLGSFIGLKYAMKNRSGRGNAFVFGMGMGGFECILNGGTVYITNIIAAVLINSVGSQEYFKKISLSGKELAETQALFATQSATPACVFLMDASYLILSMILCVAATLLIYCSINEDGKRYFFPLAIVLHILGYIPVYLTNIPAWQNSTLLFGIAIVYTFAVAFLAYQVYCRYREK